MMNPDKLWMTRSLTVFYSRSHRTPTGRTSQVSAYPRRLGRMSAGRVGLSNIARRKSIKAETPPRSALMGPTQVSNVDYAIIPRDLYLRSSPNPFADSDNHHGEDNGEAAG